MVRDKKRSPLTGLKNKKEAQGRLSTHNEYRTTLPSVSDGGGMFRCPHTNFQIILKCTPNGRPAPWPSGRESSVHATREVGTSEDTEHTPFVSKSTGLCALLSRCSVAVSQAVVYGLRERVCEEGERGDPADRNCGGFREKRCYASGGLRRNHQISQYSTPGAPFDTGVFDIDSC